MDIIHVLSDGKLSTDDSFDTTIGVIVCDSCLVDSLSTLTGFVQTIGIDSFKSLLSNL